MWEGFFIRRCLKCGHWHGRFTRRCLQPGCGCEVR